MKSICVYCGSSDTVHHDYLQAAQRLGKAVAQRGLQIVYGGGSTGLMGAVANAALEAGGRVVGILPEIFYRPSLAHSALTRLEVVPTMHHRKARMVELADAIIALPGGFGTLEELFEALTWAQIGLHHKPIGLLNSQRYFDPLLSLIEHARSEGFIYREHGSLFLHASEPEHLLDALARYQPPHGLERWLQRDG
jgi:uncharacterized protein (TIGR00730 family)